MPVWTVCEKKLHGIDDNGRTLSNATNFLFFLKTSPGLRVQHGMVIKI